MGVKPLRKMEADSDFAGLSDVFSEDHGEPVWCYSWGNARWLRAKSKCCKAAKEIIATGKQGGTWYHYYPKGHKR